LRFPASVTIGKSTFAAITAPKSAIMIRFIVVPSPWPPRAAVAGRIDQARPAIGANAADSAPRTLGERTQLGQHARGVWQGALNVPKEDEFPDRRRRASLRSFPGRTHPDEPRCFHDQAQSRPTPA
jgi:hypothetical protein